MGVFCFKLYMYFHHCFVQWERAAACSLLLLSSGALLAQTRRAQEDIQQHLLHSSTFHSNTATLTLIHFTAAIWVCIEGEESGEG